jgi:hypothetical protein
LATRIVHCKKEPFDVYIGRPSFWRNHFKMIENSDTERAEVIARYKEWAFHPDRASFRVRVKHELRGKVLGCWCAPKPCHGDILVAIAEEN